MSRRKNSFIVLFLLLCFSISALFVSRVFVYDTNVAHPGLTKAAGELYNRTIGHPKLTTEEIGWLAQGAIDEDYPPRWLNHFYDPIHNRGYLGVNESAKDWATDPEKQSGFALGDQSWQRAIYEYQQGHKQKAFVALGHVLHLLEDMTVPAHTRDDGHPEGDPYEVWVRENYKTVESNIILQNNLAEYFDFLAKYSNENFYSLDTVGSYLSPRILNDRIKENYLENDFLGKIALVSTNLVTGHKTYSIDDRVKMDNFSLLAPKAIGAGAGVIKLFFEEAAKAPIARPTKLWQTSLTGYLQEPIGRMVSTAEPLIDSVKSFLTNPSDSAKQWQLVKDVFTTGVALAKETPRQIGATAISAVRNMAMETPEIVSDLLQSALPSASSPVAPMPAPVTGFHTNQPEQVVRGDDSVNATESASTFSDGFLSKPTKTIPLAIAPAPLITAPVVTPIIFGGSYSSSAAVPEKPVTATIPPASVAVEPASSPALSQSEPTSIEPPISTTVEENKNTTSTPIIIVPEDTFGPTSTISIKINSADHKKLTVSWTADDGLGSGVAFFEIEYATSTNQWLSWFSNTTSTAADFLGEEGNEYQFRARATDSLNNIGDWSPPATATIALPHVVINEIAWAGTMASPNDEWLELYNTSAFDVDLSNWTLTDGNDINFVFPASSTFAQGDFYLLESMSDKPVANRVANFIYTGSLSNSGEHLQLKDSLGRLIDDVDCHSKWFAGTVGYDYDSMERIDSMASSSISSNWRVAFAAARNGTDAKGNAIAGTPGRLNSSQRFLNGTIDQDKNLFPLRDPYLLGALTVASGTVLTINPGTIILGGTGSVLNVFGQLKINGRAESPVIFSSLSDAYYRGDLTYYSKFWDRIEVQPGGQAEIKNTRLLYGSASALADKEGGVLRVNDGVLLAENLEIYKTNQEVGEFFAIRLNNSSSTINQSKINFGSKGIKAIGGQLTLSNTEISEMATDVLWSENTQTILRENHFIHNGWGYSNRPWWQRPMPLNAPVFIKNSLPEAKGNIFQSNIFDALEVAGQISASGTVDNVNEPPWLNGGWQIMPGVEVAITPGSRLKMKTGAKITVNGALLAKGTQEANIVFTSWHDDSDGFDSDTFSHAVPATQGNEWQQIVFDSTATSTLDYVRVFYANAATNGSVVIKNTPIALSNSLIQYSRPQGVGLRLQNASQAVIKDIIIKNDYKIPFDISGYAYGVGILVDGGAPIILSATIDSFTYGIMTQNHAAPQIDNLLLKNVDVPMVMW